MFKISEFSTLTQVPIHTLRYYDELGLLKPSYLDPLTSHRTYTPDQITRLTRILTLKDFGLTYEQIGEWLDKDLPTEKLVEMLHLKRAELQTQIHAFQERLTRLDSRLSLLEQEGKPPQYEITQKSVAAQAVLSRRQVVKDFNELVTFSYEVRDLAAATRFTYWLHIYHHEGFREQDLDIEIAIPTNAAYPLSALTLHHLPALSNAASLLFTYQPNTFRQIHTEMGIWIKTNGYRIAAPIREVYLDSTRQLMELIFPIEKAADVNLYYPRFTDSTKRVFDFACQTAQALNHVYVGTEHILLGLVYIEELPSLKSLDILAVCRAVEARFPQGQTRPTELHLADRTLKTFEMAATFGDQITPQNVLRVLLEQKTCAAAVILMDMSVIIDE